ncbi:unnamed protein product, partial [Sphacelaria rigidula]
GGEADAGIARTGEGGGDDLEEVGAPPLPPPMARQESLSVDIKVAAIPITISTSALTELSWILGGFSVGLSNDGKAQRTGTTEQAVGSR